MKDMKHEYIIKVFTNLKKLKSYGIWFSGIKGEGIFKGWHENGKLYNNGFFKDGKEDGEHKNYYSDGSIANHFWYNMGFEIMFPKDKKLKNGYILGSDGKYYKD